MMRPAIIHRSTLPPMIMHANSRFIRLCRRSRAKVAQIRISTMRYAILQLISNNNNNISNTTNTTLILNTDKDIIANNISIRNITIHNSPTTSNNILFTALTLLLKRVRRHTRSSFRNLYNTHKYLHSLPSSL